MIGRYHRQAGRIAMRQIVKRLIVAGLAMLGPDAGAQQGRATEARVITFTDHGFEPSAVTVKPGPVWLIVRSRVAGQRGFELKAVGRTLPDAVLTERGKKVIRQQMTLPPGEYEVRESRYPQWICRISAKP